MEHVAAYGFFAVAIAFVGYFAVVLL